MPSEHISQSPPMPTLLPLIRFSLLYGTCTRPFSETIEPWCAVPFRTNIVCCIRERLNPSSQKSMLSTWTRLVSIARSLIFILIIRCSSGEDDLQGNSRQTAPIPVPILRQMLLSPFIHCTGTHPSKCSFAVCSKFNPTICFRMNIRKRAVSSKDILMSNNDAAKKLCSIKKRKQ